MSLYNRAFLDKFRPLLFQSSNVTDPKKVLWLLERRHFSFPLLGVYELCVLCLWQNISVDSVCRPTSTIGANNQCVSILPPNNPFENHDVTIWKVLTLVKMTFPKMFLKGFDERLLSKCPCCIPRSVTFVSWQLTVIVVVCTGTSPTWNYPSV